MFSYRHRGRRGGAYCDYKDLSLVLTFPRPLHCSKVFIDLVEKLTKNFAQSSELILTYSRQECL